MAGTLSGPPWIGLLTLNIEKKIGARATYQMKAIERLSIHICQLNAHAYVHTTQLFTFSNIDIKLYSEYNMYN